MPHSFDAFCAYLRRASGLIIDSEKRYLVESKVMPLVRREGLKSLSELVKILERGTAPALAGEVVQAMTVNETYFFRDKLPFDKFRDVVLPKLINARGAEKQIRIWCATCSSGQEPYSISMLLDESARKLTGWKTEIVATDLSETILSKARSGLYTQFEVQRGLSTAQLLRYFNQTGDKWQLSETIRSKVTFRQFNLLSDYGVLGRFDVIFCRNVLIYFDAARKSDVLTRMARILAPDGYLVLGASESIIGLGVDLVPDREHHSFLVRAERGRVPETRAVGVLARYRDSREPPTCVASYPGARCGTWNVDVVTTKWLAPPPDQPGARLSL